MKFYPSYSFGDWHVRRYEPRAKSEMEVDWSRSIMKPGMPGLVHALAFEPYKYRVLPRETERSGATRR